MGKPGPDRCSKTVAQVGIKPRDPAVGVEGLFWRGQPDLPQRHTSDKQDQGHVGMVRLQVRSGQRHAPQRVALQLLCRQKPGTQNMALGRIAPAICRVGNLRIQGRQALGQSGGVHAPHLHRSGEQKHEPRLTADGGPVRHQTPKLSIGIRPRSTVCGANSADSARSPSPTCI